MNNFEITQIVCLKSDSSKKGAIVAIKDGVYSVFIDGAVKMFYPSQLLAITESENATIKFSDYTDFHNYMTATEIREPNNSSLFSLNSGKITFIPYQYRPVLKFIKADEPRILIADSVGVGKTIEAELILKEWEARKDIESVAIICPKPLISEKKWENELKRFGEDFEALDGKALKFCIEETDTNGEWPKRYNRCIIPYSLFDEELLTGQPAGSPMKHKGLLDLDPAPHFDLVIVDEAHHIKNPATSRNKVTNYFVQNSTAAVFLTATPLELKSDDLFVLLSSLRPDLFLDRASFKKMIEPNKFINDAAAIVRHKGENWQENAVFALESAEETNWGRKSFKVYPEFQEIKSKLKSSNLTDEERVRLITDIEKLNTLNMIINRTRRRDIGNFTVRKPKTVRCEFTADQKEFYSGLIETQKQIFQFIHGENVNFMMSMILRQCASCIFGMIPLLEQIQNRNIVALQETFLDINEKTLEIFISKIKGKFSDLKAKAEKISKRDIKFENLLKTIKEKQEMDKNKIIIFSTFRHTLSYLMQKLEEEDFRVAVIHGGVIDEERRALRERFKKDKSDKDALDILLFSEVGCEGLDYQFCDYMVNYDLPWNPMRIEQRIGRIDRNGQESEAVVIVNMITQDTIDQDIYDRCLLRIGIFEESIGDCEGILGEIAEKIENIALSFNLTSAEKAEKLQQLADNEIRLIQEKERLENEQYNLLGIKINQEDLDREIKEATNNWTSPAELKTLLQTYLENLGYNFVEKEKDVYHLRLAKEIKEKLLADYRKLGVKSTGINLDWERYLKNGDQYFNISFVSNEKSKSENCVLLNVQHPLIKQAAKTVDIEKPRYISIKMPCADSGESYFIAYQWKYKGATTDSKVVIVSDNEELEKTLEERLSSVTEFTSVFKPQKEKWDKLNSIHQAKWEKEKDDFVAKSKKIIDFKKRSLENNFIAEKLSIEAVLSETNDEKIQKMKRSQLENSTDKYNRKINELNEKLEKVDILFKPLVYGIVKIGE